MAVGMFVLMQNENEVSGSLSETSPLLVTGPIDGHSVHFEVQDVGTHWFASSFIVINAALGGALLTFPEAFHTAGGVLPAMMIQLGLLTFIIASLLVIAYCSDMQHVATYQDVLQSMCGRLGRILCSLCIVLYCFGTCITFFMIIADQWDRFLLFVTKDDNFCLKWYMNRRFTMSVTSTLFILPLCFPKRIDFLRHVSALGVAGIAYVGVLIIVKYIEGDPNGHPTDIKTRPDHWFDVFNVVPTICFGYQCHVSVVPVYSCMKNRCLKNFGKTIAVAIFVCLLCYSTSAVFGYLTFGGKVNDDVLVSYTPTWAVLIGCLLLAIKIYTTYPILHFCGRSAFESLLCEFMRLEASREPLRRSIETLVWFFFSMLLAVTIPAIRDVISLLGGLAAVFILVFPGMCLMSLCYDQSPVWSIRKFRLLLASSCVFIIIGVFIFGLSTAQSIIEIISSTHPATFGPVKPCLS